MTDLFPSPPAPTRSSGAPAAAAAGKILAVAILSVVDELRRRSKDGIGTLVRHDDPAGVFWINPDAKPGSAIGYCDVIVQAARAKRLVDDVPGAEIPTIRLRPAAAIAPIEADLVEQQRREKEAARR